MKHKQIDWMARTVDKEKRASVVSGPFPTKRAAVAFVDAHRKLPSAVVRYGHTYVYDPLESK